jgi:DNA-binding CsgD family transcriptional regulator
MRSLAVEDLSRLVFSIYAAALDPSQWVSVLAEINRAFDGSGVALMIPDAVSWYNSTLPAEAGDAYRRYYHQLDRVAAATECGPVGVVRSGTELMPLVRDSEFADWLRPYDIDDALAVRLTDGDRPSCVIVAAPRRTERFDGPDRMTLMRALVPHLQQAVRTQGRLAELSSAADDLTAALDTVRHATVIVRPDLRVVYVNRAAEGVFRAGDGVSVHAARLAATSGQVHLRLQRALRDALDDEPGERIGRTITCERPSGRRPYLLDVHPLDHREFDGKPCRTAALVLIIDPDQDESSAADALRSRYGLTAAEAEVALHVVRGEGLAAIGDQLSVSLTTVRKHLQHVFDKTGTHRQAELVRLALTLPR